MTKKTMEWIGFFTLIIIIYFFVKSNRRKQRNKQGEEYVSELNRLHKEFFDMLRGSHNFSHLPTFHSNSEYELFLENSEYLINKQIFLNKPDFKLERIKVIENIKLMFYDKKIEAWRFESEEKKIREDKVKQELKEKEKKRQLHLAQIESQRNEQELKEKEKKRQLNLTQVESQRNEQEEKEKTRERSRLASEKNYSGGTKYKECSNCGAWHDANYNVCAPCNGWKPNNGW